MHTYRVSRKKTFEDLFGDDALQVGTYFKTTEVIYNQIQNIPIDSIGMF